jgi:hypothetical protein
VNRGDRQQRLDRIKALGRIAYRHLRDAEIVGNITVGGEKKWLRTLEEGRLLAALLEPFRASAPPTDYSQILIRFDGSKVFEVRWELAPSRRSTSSRVSGSGC